MAWQSSEEYQEVVSRAHQMDDSLSSGYQGGTCWSGANWPLNNADQQYPHPGLHLFLETRSESHDEKTTAFPDIDSIISYPRNFLPLGKIQRSK